MRGPISCGVVEAFPGSLTGFPELLATWRVASERLSPEQANAEAHRRTHDLMLVDMASQPASRAMRQLLVRRTETAQPVVALCRRDASLQLSQALALGCDDALAFPLDDLELHQRMRCLSALAVAEREQARRARLLVSYADKPVPSRRRPTYTPVVPRAEILLAGRASEHQVRIANGVGPAVLTYADEAHAVTRLLSERRFELIWATIAEPGAKPLLPASALSGDATADPPVRILAGPMADEQGFAAAVASGFEDVLPMPQPPELIRLRTQFWLRVHGLRHRLRAPIEGGAGQLAVDAMTGLFNEGFLSDYVSALMVEHSQARPLSLMVAAVRGVSEMAEQHGHAISGRAISGIGRLLGRMVRPEDVAAHLGGGRFAVVLDGTEATTDERVAERVRRELHHVPLVLGAHRAALQVDTAIVRIGRPDELVRSLDRTLRDLGYRSGHAA
jgi:diguanylate cyclase (GGDEF)-like protein